MTSPARIRQFAAEYRGHGVWGEYGRLKILNWATKFFVDALLPGKADFESVVFLKLTNGSYYCASRLWGTCPGGSVGSRKVGRTDSASLRF
jgi:hypothetical protein